MVVYAQRCPLMMELAAKPMAPPIARALCSSSSSHQKTEDITSAGEGEGGKGVDAAFVFFNAVYKVNYYQVTQWLTESIALYGFL